MDDRDRPPQLDEQTAHDEPEGPGESKRDNLRRIDRSVEEQRRREREARGDAEAQERPEPPG